MTKPQDEVIVKRRVVVEGEGEDRHPPRLSMHGQRVRHSWSEQVAIGAARPSTVMPR
jgi:hypothetical protein